jgi:hypothetical protein
MKISYKEIMEKQPSNDLRIWWLEKYCRDYIEHDRFLEECPNYLQKQWFKDQYFCQELQEFDGIKVGDYVYFENYGIGSIGKDIVSKIELTTRNVVYFWIGKKEKHYEWTREKIFKTLDGLKDYWIRKITHIKEPR